MQRLLAETASRSQLRWSFRVARGKVAAEINTLAQALDFIVLGKRTGIGVMTVVQTTVRLADVQPKAGPVLVLFEDLPTSGRSLETGAMLARSNDAQLVLLIKDGDEDACRAACVAAECHGGGQPASGSAPRTGLLLGAGRPRTLPQPGRFRADAGCECPVVLAR